MSEFSDVEFEETTIQNNIKYVILIISKESENYFFLNHINSLRYSGITKRKNFF